MIHNHMISKERLLDHNIFACSLRTFTTRLSTMPLVKSISFGVSVSQHGRIQGLEKGGRKHRPKADRWRRASKARSHAYIRPGKIFGRRKIGGGSPVRPLGSAPLDLRLLRYFYLSSGAYIHEFAGGELFWNQLYFLENDFH